MKQASAAVISNREVMPDTYLTWLESPQIASGARPGQFVMALSGNSTEFPLRRPLSIHQRSGGQIAFLLNVVGKGTGWLSRLKSGDEVDLLGPLGNGFNIRPQAKNLLLVAGGIGIAPLCFLAQEAISTGHPVTLLLGAYSENQLYPTSLLPPEVNLVTATETGQGIMITSLIPEFSAQADQIFACGPTPMYRNIAQMPELKDKPVQISLETRMGCGVGVCYACTVKTIRGLEQVCRHGPVFEMGDIIWDALDSDI